LSKQTSKIFIRVYNWVRRRAVGCLLKKTLEVILLLSFVPPFHIVVTSLLRVILLLSFVPPFHIVVTSLLEWKIEYILVLFIVSFSMRTGIFPGSLPPMFDCFSEQIPRFELLHTVFERTSVLSL
jgi:hypothetical protein